MGEAALHIEPTPDTSTWQPVDLAAVLNADTPRLVPTIFTRDDGRSLIYPGRTHSIVGETESLKTWAALIAVTQELQAGGTVAYLDFEDDASMIVRRRLHDELRVPTADLIERFRYVRPSEPASRNALDAITAEPRPTLAIIDGLTEAMALHGLNPNDGRDIATFYALVPRRLAECGAAVLTLDHVVKDRESRGRYASGSVHKLNAVTGASYTMELGSAPSRGAAGFSRLMIAKDRPSEVRPHSLGKQAATLHIESNDAGCVSWRLAAPTAATADSPLRPTWYMERVSELLAESDEPMSQRQVVAAVGRKAEVVRLALSHLTSEGYIRCTNGSRNALLYTHVKGFSE